VVGRSAAEAAELSTAGAKGALVLFTNQALSLTRERIARLANGVPLSKISYPELYAALDALKSAADLCELAASYKLALKEQEQRVGLRGDPNL
jgi:hypothetical protein